MRVAGLAWNQLLAGIGNDTEEGTPSMDKIARFPVLLVLAFLLKAIKLMGGKRIAIVLAKKVWTNLAACFSECHRAWKQLLNSVRKKKQLHGRLQGATHHPLAKLIRRVIEALLKSC